MSKVKIISDSACDLPEYLAAEYGISVVPFHVSLDGEKYLAENIDITNKQFYKILRDSGNSIYPKTSLPTIEAYADEFRKHTAQGLDVICFSITGKFSGSHQSANNAAALVNEELGKTAVYAIDSLQATCAEGAVAIEAAKMRDAGMTAAEICAKINSLKETCILYITVDTLAYLQKGGRIGRASALAGSFLNIKPIIVLKDGELAPIAKVRGRKKALNALAENIIGDIGNNKDEYEFFIVSADEREEMAEFAKHMEDRYGIKLSYPIMDVGVTIGAHVGPGAVGLGYIKKFRKE